MITMAAQAASASRSRASSAAITSPMTATAKGSRCRPVSKSSLPHVGSTKRLGKSAEDQETARGEQRKTKH